MRLAPSNMSTTRAHTTPVAHTETRLIRCTIQSGHPPPLAVRSTRHEATTNAPTLVFAEGFQNLKKPIRFGRPPPLFPFCCILVYFVGKRNGLPLARGRFASANKEQGPNSQRPYVHLRATQSTLILTVRDPLPTASIVQVRLHNHLSKALSPRHQPPHTLPSLLCGY